MSTRKKHENSTTAERLINWRQLSRLLAGNTTSVRRLNTWPKYQAQVDGLKKHIQKWLAEQEID
jgi:hypothetical protein